MKNFYLFSLVTVLTVSALYAETDEATIDELFYKH